MCTIFCYISNDSRIDFFCLIIYNGNYNYYNNNVIFKVNLRFYTFFHYLFESLKAKYFV